MPDEPETTAAEDQTTDTGAEETAPAYVFPFDVPSDLSTLDEGALRALHVQVREHGVSFAAGAPNETSPDRLDALTACRDLALAIRDQIDAIHNAAELAVQDAAAAADLAAELDVDLPDPPAPPVEPPPAVTASARRGATPPKARDVARRTTAAPAVPQADRGRASLTASSDFGGFHTGQPLGSVAEAAQILARRVDQYPAAPLSNRRSSTGPRPVEVYEPGSGRRMEMRNFNRHAGVQIRRDFPDALRVRQGQESQAYEIAQYAASERRLPGGSLIESMQQAMTARPKGKRSLTAAAGWCAPSDVIYDLVELETLEGILDSPELQTPRGGWQIPEDGGIDFSTIWTSIGNSGDTHLTEAEVIADTSKVCVEIPCPDFIEKRLDFDYVCITGSLLQRRGYPEAVARFARGALVALAHKINAGYINALVDGSDSRILGSDDAGDDAASAVLAAVELAAEDIKARNRMSDSATIEVVIPSWVRGPIRAALSRRLGVAMLSVTDAMILDWFVERGVAPRLVRDWQDSYNGTGLGGSTPASAYPTRVKFLAYPAGTWVKAVADVIDLDTVYDSTLLAANQYTALFSETGWQALKMGPTSYLYDVPVDVSGVVACCPDEAIS